MEHPFTEVLLESSCIFFGRFATSIKRIFLWQIYLHALPGETLIGLLPKHN